MKKRNLMNVALITLGLLLIPLIAMQVTAEVNWNLTDFIVMGIMIFVTGSLIDFAKSKMGKYKFIGIGGIVLLFLWFWAELAVGIFTNWGS